ncbi:Mesoderm posterior protein 2 Class C basic helix-loop-helix protein 6 [Larimichthys crocea]|uniref:Mesoderm posterior protein 2 Class C basic helix-loop-helix protein 6 n=1 Tax=Larimichthys crocea TaxID=215358 RepID=A0A6G0J1L6_LARCR|nr:Mesoderm posterior protein 2 Class C basic helix-loop-helix protein 6 [Larimichthys crocea]
MAGSFSQAAGAYSVNVCKRVSHLVSELACFPWDPLAEVSALLPELLKTRGGCRRCNLTPPTTYMVQPPWSSSLSSFCLTSNTDSSLLREELTATEPTTTTTMEMSYCTPLQLQENAFLFDCESLLDKSSDPLAFDPTSDPGYFSAGSSLSPTSSVDSFCFSPTTLQAAGNEQNALDCFIFNSPAAPHLTQETQTVSCSKSSTTTTTTTTKKSRSRYPGKKRQTASEREKLRMRDLTKAMHHLRAYLPPSVAPAGQTLTKIETLRLTIRYISYLSAQLGISEEALEQRRSSGFVEQPQAPNHFLGQANSNLQPTRIRLQHYEHSSGVLSAALISGFYWSFLHQ